MVKIGQALSEVFEDYLILYIAQGIGQIIPWGKIFDCN